MGGKSIKSDVPILRLRLPSKPKKVNRGTISISEPPPTNPPNNPVTAPMIVNPTI